MCKRTGYILLIQTMRADHSIDDAHIEKIFQEHELLHPNITCPSGNKAFEICVTE